jgi:hypothetical protein
MRCGNTANVFTDAVYNENTHTYTLTPICINCKKTDLEVSNVISWERELQGIEESVANQLINEKFSKIKFKNRAREILVDLMKKYTDIPLKTMNGDENKVFERRASTVRGWIQWIIGAQV